jgi:hypothetical protein
MIDTSKIKPCPATCAFDWKKFHKDLDTAVAHAITEIPDFSLSSSVMDFIKYSFKKSQ